MDLRSIVGVTSGGEGVFWMLVGLILLASAALYVIASVVMVDSGNIGLVFRFGKFRRILSSGLNFINPIFDKVEPQSTQTRQRELPAEPEFIDRENDTLPPNMKHPFRVAHKGKEEAIFYVKKDERVDPKLAEDEPLSTYKKVRFQDLDPATQKAMENDPLHAPITGEIAVAVEWSLKGDDLISIKNFIENISPEGGRGRSEEVWKRIEDMVSRSLQEFLGPTTFGHASEMLPLFSKIIQKRLENLVGEDSQDEETKPWGIHIGDAYIKSVHAGKSINKARNEAAAAVSRKQDLIRMAEGQAEATQKQATANKFAEIQKGEGEAGRITAMAAAMMSENAKFIAELDVRERGYEAYEKNTTVTTYAPGTKAMLPLSE